MCFKLQNKVVSIKSGLTLARKAILFYLAYRTNESTGRCNPSVRTISRDIALTYSATIKNLSWLIENEWISKTNSNNLTNQYNFNLSKFPVDNSEDKKTPGPLRGPVNSPLRGPGVVLSEDQNSQINDHSFNNHYDHASAACGQREMVIEFLHEKIQTTHRNINRYIKKYGLHTLYHSGLVVEEVHKKTPIKNKAAYLATILKNLDNYDNKCKNKSYGT